MPDSKAIDDRPKSSPALTREQLRARARLVADGESEWPSDLNAAQERLLTDEVRRLRRSRLIRFFAHQLARDLFREQTGGHQLTETTYAKAKN